MHSTHNIEVILFLMLATAVFSLIAKRVSVPAPIIMTIAGLGMSVIPGFPTLHLDPNVVFLLILPPLLYVAGTNTSWRDFRLQMRAIVLLATGLVITTALAIAWVAMQIIPDMTWPVAILLGAIIAPPDAVAATTIAQKLNLPKRIVTILEGESLLNDASSLVMYKLALAVIASGVYSWQAISMDFAQMAIGGVSVGLLAGYAAVKLRKPIDDPSVEIILSLLTPFAAYLLAEELGGSGILSVVACGLYVGWYLPLITSSSSRLMGFTVWTTVSFLLNNIVFLMIGLQLPQILASVRHYSFEELVYYTSAIALVMIAVRLIWVFPSAYIPRFLFASIRKREIKPPPGWVAFIGWAGMRGVVSLAAALALPVELESGDPFPLRNLILFLAFAIIILTIVVQGLSLGAIARFLRIPLDNSELAEERLAREHALRMALKRLQMHRDHNSHHHHILDALETTFQMRLESLDSGQSEDDEVRVCVDSHHELHQQLIQLQRQALLDLRHSKKIGDAVMRRVMRELDLEELQHKAIVA